LKIPNKCALALQGDGIGQKGRRRRQRECGCASKTRHELGEAAEMREMRGELINASYITESIRMCTFWKRSVNFRKKTSLGSRKVHIGWLGWTEIDG
jgi:hypothetical protein